MSQANRDENRITTIIGTSSSDGETPVNVYVDPTTNELFVKASSISDSRYGTNHIDDYTTSNVTYIGQEDASGVWKMIKIDETGNFPVFTYAAISNNPTLTTYALAWAGRVAATYNIYSEVF